MTYDMSSDMAELEAKREHQRDNLITEQREDITRLRGALTALLVHIDRVAYRDNAGLRLGDAVPFYNNAQQALTQEPT